MFAFHFFFHGTKRILCRTESVCVHIYTRFYRGIMLLSVGIFLFNLGLSLREVQIYR